MTGSFFGLPFSVSSIAVAGLIFLGGLFALWTAYRAVRTGVLNWNNERTAREEGPKLFAFFVAVVMLVGLVAVAGSLMMFVDLGMKP